MTNFWSAVLHGIAGAVVFGGVFLTFGVPADIQAMTVGGVLAALLKWAHLVYGA